MENPYGLGVKEFPKRKHQGEYVDEVQDGETVSKKTKKKLREPKLFTLISLITNKPS